MRVQQISVFLENRKGSLAALCRVLGADGINLLALSIAEVDNFGIARCIVSNTKKCINVLRTAGYTTRLSDVLVVRVPDEPNGLGDILHVLEEEDISVEYLYSFVRNAGLDAMLICKVSDNEKAEESFNKAGITLLAQEDIDRI